MNEAIPPAARKWREVLDRFGSSGLSAAAFCRQSGIAESSFFAWRRRLGPRPAAPSQAPAFVEAKVAEAKVAEAKVAEAKVADAGPAAVGPAGPAGTARPAGAIEVRLRGGRRVRVGRGFDRALLAEVVAALEVLP